jgi:hypothetical protein
MSHAQSHDMGSPYYVRNRRDSRRKDDAEIAERITGGVRVQWSSTVRDETSGADDRNRRMSQRSSRPRNRD